MTRVLALIIPALALSACSGGSIALPAIADTRACVGALIAHPAVRDANTALDTALTLPACQLLAADTLSTLVAQALVTKAR